MNRFYTSAYDFYVCRTYLWMASNGEGELVNRLEELDRGGMLRTVKLFLLVFPCVIIQGVLAHIDTSNFIINALRIGVFPPIMIILIVTAFLNLRWAAREHTRFEKSIMNRPSNLDEQVMMYEVASDGIYINLYNKWQYSDMIFLPWSKLTKGVVKHLYYTRGPIKHNQQDDKRRALRMEIAGIQKHHPDFDFEARVKHEQYQTIVCKTETGYHHTYSYLPIPTQWSQQEVKVFLDTIRQHIPVEIYEYEYIQVEEVLLNVWNKITNKNKKE